MSEAEFDEWFDSDDWPHVVGRRTPFELKSADAGVLPDGRRVMVDYGMLGYRQGCRGSAPTESASSALARPRPRKQQDT